MEKVCEFKGVKEIVRVTSDTEVCLPECTDMRKIYLRSKQEVKSALDKGNVVYQERVEGDFGERIRTYIEVPFDKLLDLANTH